MSAAHVSAAPVPPLRLWDKGERTPSPTDGHPPVSCDHHTPPFCGGNQPPSIGRGTPLPATALQRRPPLSCVGGYPPPPVGRGTPRPATTLQRRQPPSATPLPAVTPPCPAAAAAPPQHSDTAPPCGDPLPAAASITQGRYPLRRPALARGDFSRGVVTPPSGYLPSCGHVAPGVAFAPL